MHYELNNPISACRIFKHYIKFSLLKPLTHFIHLLLVFLTLITIWEGQAPFFFLFWHWLQTFFVELGIKGTTLWAYSTTFVRLNLWGLFVVRFCNSVNLIFFSRNIFFDLKLLDKLVIFDSLPLLPSLVVLNIFQC